MRIVKMQPEHVAAVVEMERQCFSDPWSEKSVASELDNPLSLWLIAEADGVVAGYVGSQTVLDSADMMNLAVSQDFRRQGIGEQLVNSLTEALAEKGVKTLLLKYGFPMSLLSSCTKSWALKLWESAPDITKSPGKMP